MCCARSSAAGARPTEAGLLARAAAIPAAGAQLTGGHDVIIPQLLGKSAFIRQLERLAEQSGASFHEFALLGGEQQVLRRFAERGPDPHHLESSAAEISALYRHTLAMIRDRPKATVLNVDADGFAVAYRNMLARLANPR